MDVRSQCDSDEVFAVISAAIKSGEASVYEQEGTLIYHDPYFGDDIPVRDLRYNKDIGLHGKDWQ